MKYFIFYFFYYSPNDFEKNQQKNYVLEDWYETFAKSENCVNKQSLDFGWFILCSHNEIDTFSL